MKKKGRKTSAMKPITNNTTQAELEMQMYNKVSQCVYPFKYRCKGCNFNSSPDLADGGCTLPPLAVNNTNNTNSFKSSTINEVIDFIINTTNDINSLIGNAHKEVSKEPTLNALAEIQLLYKSKPYIKAMKLQESLRDALLSLPYLTIWIIEAFMLVGRDIFYEDLPQEIQRNKSVLESPLTLADLYNVPTSIKDGGNQEKAIDYMLSKRNISQYLIAYRKICNIV